MLVAPRLSTQPWFSFMLAFLAVLAAGAPAPARADQQEKPPPPPTSEEIAAMAEQAENAPLFASHEVLVVTLEADIEDLKRERDQDIEREGTFTFMGPDNEPMTVSVKLTTRGIFRLDKRNCNFPLYRSQFLGQVGGLIRPPFS